MSRILIIEDEETIAELEKDYLELSGFEVEIENDGAVGLERSLKEDFDLFILDLMLPGTDGFEICRRIREVKNAPVLMVSAKKEDIDKIRGLGLGADDYITKPFKMSEMIARVNAVLRRAAVARKAVQAANAVSVSDQDPMESRIEYQTLCIDPNDKTCYIDGSIVPLTKTEFEILSFFLTHRNRIYSREEIIRRVWDDDVVVTTRTIDTNITRLRKKIGAYGNNIETRLGFGYGFKEKD